MPRNDPFTGRAIAGLILTYVLLWVLSLFYLIPHYLSTTFTPQGYLQRLLLSIVSVQLTQRGFPYPFFLAWLALLLPPLSLLTLFLAWGVEKASGTIDRIRVISRALEAAARVLLVASFIPMVWITRELIRMTEPTFIFWLSILAPALYNGLQQGRQIVGGVVTAARIWIRAYGPAGVVSATILGSLISPIPNEVILAFAGMVMHPLEVGFYGGIGSTVGGIICFSVARYGGRPLAERFVKGATLTSVDRWFQRWGSWAIILGRLIPFIPFDAVSYLAGLSAVETWKFTLLTFVGAVPRCILYAYVGGMIAGYTLPALIATTLIAAILMAAARIKKVRFPASG